MRAVIATVLVVGGPAIVHVGVDFLHADIPFAVVQVPI